MTLVSATLGVTGSGLRAVEEAADAGAGAGCSLIVGWGAGLVAPAVGVTGSGLRALGAAIGAPTGAGAVGFGTAMEGLGAPADEGGAEGIGGDEEGEAPGGLNADREAGGTGGLRDPGVKEEGTDPTCAAVEGIGNPAAGIGLGGSFNGGSFRGEGEPAGKSDTGGGFGDGVSFTTLRRIRAKIMVRKHSCQSCSQKQTNKLWCGC